MDEPLTLRDFEYGMTYTRPIDTGAQKQDARRVIFTFKEKSPKGEAITINAIRTDESSWFKESFDLGVSGFHCRKASVNDEVWLEECVKSKKRIPLDEALANFQKRFEQNEEKKSFRIGYIDSHRTSRSKVVDAETEEEAISKIPEFESMTYSTVL